MQVNPVFLVALAVEQTLAQSLGTESAYAAEAEKKAVTDFRPPPEYDEWWDFFRNQASPVGVTVSRRSFDDAYRLSRRSHGHQWNEFGAALATSEADANLLLSSLGALALHDGRSDEDGEIPIMRVSRDRLYAYVRKLRNAAEGSLLAAEKQRASARAIGEYRRRKRARRVSIITAVGLLAVSEAVAFVGLLSPGGSYRGLFAASAALLTASFVAVVVSAIRALLTE